MIKARGKFIVFEGLDGCGHSTQAKLYKEHLEKQGHTVLLTHEPTYESEASKKIKEALQHRIKLEPLEMQKLYVEDRRWHVNTIVLPALLGGKTVVGDRYYFSTFAYGSLAVPLETLIELNKEFPAPDLTFVIKARPETCLERIGKRGDGFELFDVLEKQKKIWETYELLPTRFPNIHIIEGDGTIEEVWNNVIAISA